MKIKILETIRQGLIGGGETHLLSLVEQLDQNIYEPSVLSFTDGPMVDRAKALGLQTRVIQTNMPFDFTVWKNVRKLIREWKIDLVHAHGTRAVSNVMWAAKAEKIPLIYTVHGWCFHRDQKAHVRKMRILCEKYITTRTEMNISVSAANKETGKSLLKDFESVVIPNGIDQKKFDPKKSYKDIREEIGIPKDALLVLFIARFTHHKQPLKAVEGFYRAMQKIPDLKLLMVGEGDAKAETIARVSELGIEKQVYFQDFRLDVPDLLAASDIFVLPSLWEGMPIGLLEAMAMGKAVIASKVDGNCEVINHMKNGILIDIENIEDNLANALITLSLDNTLKSDLEQEAINTIDKYYSAAVMTHRTEEIYLKLVGKKTENKIHQFAYGI